MFYMFDYDDDDDEINFNHIVAVLQLHKKIFIFYYMVVNTFVI